MKNSLGSKTAQSPL